MASDRLGRAPAWLPSRRDVLRLGGTAAVLLIAGACGDGGKRAIAGGAGASKAERARTAFTIVALDNRWVPARIVVRAGQALVATIDNRDNGNLHNLHILADTEPQTVLERGPVTQQLAFTINRPGSYVYSCDAHPTMRGTLEVVA